MEDRRAAQVALDKVLERVRDRRIDRSRLTPFEDGNVVSGGYGNVWFATLDQGYSNSVHVAAKELRQGGNIGERIRVAIRLARELKIWAALDHPNLLPLLGFHLNEDMTVALLVSPYLRHGHIGEYLDNTTPSAFQRLQLVLDTAAGLQYLHERDPAICHGDLKSRNVLVTDNIRAVLCDFGLAKVIEESGYPSGLTTSTSVRGSTRYMSPELIKEDEPCHSLPSDIWAWGCLFVEIVAGLVPFARAQSDVAVMRCIMEGEKPTSPEGLPLPDVLRCLLDRCWQQDPTQRPAVVECLETVREALEVMEPNTSDQRAEALGLRMDALAIDGPVPSNREMLDESEPADLSAKNATLGEGIAGEALDAKLVKVSPCEACGKELSTSHSKCCSAECARTFLRTLGNSMETPIDGTSTTALGTRRKCFVEGCEKQEWRPGSKYCGNSCRAFGVILQLEPACLLCETFAKMDKSLFCSTSCSAKASNAAPCLLEVPEDHQEFTIVNDQFIKEWGHGTTPPQIRHIYLIVMTVALNSLFEYKLSQIDGRHNYETNGLCPANERRRWYGTRRECNVGDTPPTKPCKSLTCNICIIMKNSFDASKYPSDCMFGKGIYTSGTSSKSHGYVEQGLDSPYKAMLLTRVLAGREMKLTEEDHNLTQPPPGYDSVRGVPDDGLDYDELIVYDNDSIRPLYLVIYDS